MPTGAKAYSMIRQEEKQREGFASKILVTDALSAHSNNYRNSYNNSGRNGRNYSGNYSQGESSVRNSTNNGNNPRRIVFRKGVIYGNCSKEGHTKVECYQLVRCLVGHPLHEAKNVSSQQMGQSEVAMCARMDQLQKQLN
ncbi:hypothetical protein Tco_1222650 [Tanacetum coccineum]